MTRDRLPSLRKIQAQADSSNSVAFCNTNIPKDELTDFMIKVEQTREMVDKLKYDINSVKIKHIQILSSAITHENDPRKSLQDASAQIQNDTKVVYLKLKDLGSTIKSKNVVSNFSETQQRIIKIQHPALLKSFRDLINKYQNAQSDYRDKCKSRIQRQLEIAGKSVNEEEIEKALESGGSWNIFAQGILYESIQAKQMLADIEIRHQDIIQIEKSIIELNDMFLNLAVLAESQGEHIDSIENHLTKTTDHVERAKITLKVANKCKKRRRKRKVLITMLAAGALLVIGPIICM